MRFFKSPIFAAVLTSCGGLVAANLAVAGPLHIPPLRTFAYQGLDELNQVCTLSVSSDNAGRLSLVLTHGTVYIDGLIVRAGGNGQGQFVVQDGRLEIDKADERTKYTFSDFPVGNGLHLAVHQSPPEGVTGLPSDSSIDFTGFDLGSLTQTEAKGGNIGYFVHAVCRDLRLTN